MKTLGRVILCPGCGDRVDIIEIDLAGTGVRSMRPDRCGGCQDEPRPDPGRALIGRHHAAPQPTELAAARRAVKAGSQRAQVLEHLRTVGEAGATDFEMNEALRPGNRSVSAGTRRAELIADGWPIVDSGVRRETDTGTPAIVWVLAEPVTA